MQVSARFKKFLGPFILAFLGIFILSGTVLASQISNDENNQTNQESSDHDTADDIFDKKTDSLLPHNIPEQSPEQTKTAITPESVNISNTEKNSTTSISIVSRTEINGEDSSSSETKVELNGQTVEIPESGRFRKDIKTDDGRSQIRGQIDSNNTSINISTDGSTNLEAN